MAATPTTCPASEALEAVALGRPASADLQSHIAGCLLCQQALEKLREDNQFLRGFLTSLAAPSGAAPERPIDIPGYEILREIHRGGQGVVFLAVQRATKREVAIKVMRQGPFATLADRARFEREIEILGKLNHPNIVTVHDAGVAGGFHYFVMNYVAGKPFDEAVRTLSEAHDAVQSSEQPADAVPVHDSGRSVPAVRRTDIAARRGWLELFIRVCDAVHAAHLRGIIHRDLKPSNIYVDAQGEPHVLDFGIAKATDSESLSGMTQTGQFVGSLPWASPEQVDGTSTKVDLRTDVYSLGAILYQLLAGVLPFDVGSNLRSAVDDILYKEPIRPSTLAARKGLLPVDDELDTVVLKCLAKDPARRYQSAGELARDLRRYLAGEPIEAKRDSAIYMLRKAMRRYRLRVVIASIVVVVLGAFAGVMAVMYRHSARLEQEASRSADSLAVLLARSNIEQGRMAAVLGNLEQAEQLLWRELLLKRTAGAAADPKLNRPPGPPEAYWALWELYRRYPCLRSLSSGAPHRGSITPAAEGDGLWTIGVDGAARRIGEDGEERDAFQVEFVVDFGLPSIDARGKNVLRYDDGHFVLWQRAGPGEPLTRITLMPSATPLPDSWYLAPTGRHVVIVADGAARVWETSNPDTPRIFTSPGSPLMVAALSNDEALLAARDRAGDLHIWNIETGQYRTAASEHAPRGAVIRDFGPLLFSPDDRRLADGWADMAGRIWKLDTDPPAAVPLAERPADYRAMCFSPDGRWLAVGDLGGALRVFDVETGARTSLLVAHHGRILSVACTPDGERIWTCGNDGDLRLWEVNADGAFHVARVAREGFHAVDFSADGRTLYVAGGLGVLYRLDRAGQMLDAHALDGAATISSLAVSPDGRQLAAATYGNAAWLWPSVEPTSPPARLVHPNLVSCVCFSPDGSRLATACDDRTVRIWRVADAALERELTALADRVPQVAFDPGGGRLAIAVRDGSLVVWDLARDAAEAWSHAPGKPLRTVRFSPDGRWLAAAGADRTIGLWDTATHRRVDTLVGHNQEIFTLDISRDGSLIASGDTSGVVRLWDAASRRPLATFETHSNAVMQVRFARDDRALATASLDGAVHIWDLAYYGRHIAGNLENQLRELHADALDAETAASWRAWARQAQRQP